MGVAERRKREREERRGQILDAAEEVFFATSVETATMDEVAQAAELSKGALYLYFESKEELLTAVMSRCQEGFLTALGEAVSGTASGLSSLAIMLRAYVRFTDEHPDHARMLLTHFAVCKPVQGAGPEVERHRALVEQELELVMGVIERGQRDGSIRAELDPRELAVNMWGGLLGMMMLVLNQEHFDCQMPQAKPDMASAVEAFLRLFLRGVAAHPQDVSQLLDVA